MREKLIKAKAGDKKEFEELIEMFTPLAKSASFRFYIKGLDRNDIEQIAILSIMKAIKSFDPEKSDSFTSYAKVSVKNALINEMKKAENTYYREKVKTEMDEVFDIEEIKSKDIDLNEVLIRKEESCNLVKIINTLKEEDKAIIKALYIDKIKIKDYAEEKNIAYNNLVYKKNKILKYLRDEYKTLI